MDFSVIFFSLFFSEPTKFSTTNILYFHYSNILFNLKIHDKIPKKQQRKALVLNEYSRISC